MESKKKHGKNHLKKELLKHKRKNNNVKKII